MTLSDVYAVPGAAAGAAAAPVMLKKKAGAGPRARAQGASVPRVTTAAKVVWADLRESWWLPESIPTVVDMWRDRTPDVDRVPGGSELLHRAWSVYNVAVALPVVALLNLLVGVLTPVVFVLRHPARFLLAALVVAPIVAAVAAAAN